MIKSKEEEEKSRCIHTFYHCRRHHTMIYAGQRRLHLDKVKDVQYLRLIHRCSKIHAGTLPRHSVLEKTKEEKG